MKLSLYKFFILLSLVILTGCSLCSDRSNLQKLIQEGDVYFSNGDVDKAIKVWVDVLNYKQTPELYEKIVMAYIVKNQLSDAEQWTLKGLTYFPDNVNLFFDLALINFYNREFDKARENIDRVLAMNGYYRDAHFLKGLMYEEEGNISAAKREYVSEVNVNPGSRRAWKKLRELKDE